MNSSASESSPNGAVTKPPAADVPQIIRLFSAVYRENPSAVLRELLQNGSDAAQEMPANARLIEVAILNRTEDLEPGKYHLVVRDFGEGMNQQDFDNYLLVLGRTSKHNAPNKIGEFGIGFYSTHAICREVAIVSRKCGSQETIGWRYVPRETCFYRLDDDVIAELLRQDFENHPVEARRRVSGSSIYLHIDLAEFNKLSEWLVGASLARDIRRDAVLLPARLFVADYAEAREGARIPEVATRRDLRNVSLSVDPAPWETQGPEQQNAARELLHVALQYTPEEELPKEWSCFRKPIGGGNVSGMLFLVQGSPPPTGQIDLYLKRMRVETAPDVKPIWASPVFGYVNITPGNTPQERFDVQVPPARDHIIRDDNFRKAREAIEDACCEFLAEMGRRLEEELDTALRQRSSQDGVCDIVRDTLNRSALYSTLCSRKDQYNNLFMDIPDVLSEILRQKDCPGEVRDACMAFLRGLRRGDELDVSPENLPQVFRKLGEAAREEYHREIEAGGRAQLRWNPRASRLFFQHVGPLLPVTVFQREELRHGAFHVKGVRVPLCFVRHLDPAMLSEIPVLVQGRPDDFLARKERGIRTVVVPDNHLTILALAVVAHLHPEDFPITFISHKKELFTKLTDPGPWEPLVELYRTIVAGPHSRSAGTDFQVEARGYTASDHVPLLTTVENNRRVLVINGYNDLNKNILASYREARAANSEEALRLLGEICHELFHHAQPAELEGGGEDMHSLETRSTLLKDVLAILQKYNDLRR